MKNECSIVKDLLPLYAEHMTSEETTVFIKEHVAGCEGCRAALTELTAPGPALPAAEKEAAPLKTVKRKLTVKRLIIALVSVAVTVALVFGGIVLFDARQVPSAEIDHGVSELYDPAEIDAAAAHIVEKVRDMGCKLYSVRYAGDELSLKEFGYVNEFGVYDACMVFDSMFRSPLLGGSGFNANDIYTWHWYLGRTADGAWEVVQYGYP